MKSLKYIVWFLFWVLSPIFLILSVVFRYNAFSATYCLLLVTFPYSPRLRSNFMVSWRRYTRTVMLISGAFLLAQICFQLALAIMSPYGSLFETSCSQLELTLSYIGLHSFKDLQAVDVFRLLAPEIFVFPLSLVIYILENKVEVQLKAEEDLENEDERMAEEPFLLKRKVAYERLKNGGLLCFTVVFMALAGIACPNLVSSMYLLCFFFISLLWGFNQPILTPYITILRAILSAISALQLLFFYIYQIGYINSSSSMEPKSLLSRLMGLKSIVSQPCDQRFRLIRNKDEGWPVYVSLALIFTLHWSMAVGVRMFFRDYVVFLTKFGYSITTAPSVIANFFVREKPSDERPLITSHGTEDVHQQQQPQGGYGATLHNNGGNVATIPAEENAETRSADTNNAADNDKNKFLVGIYKCMEEIKSYSLYILALISMMFWSVTSQSWLTFGLLTLSLVLWCVTDSRTWTLRLSPVFTIYGMLLIMLEYIYSLDLTEEELPTQINTTNGIDLSQFGILRSGTPFLNLILKLLYLFTFLIAMNQRANILQKVAVRQTSSDMAVLAEKSYKAMCKYWVFIVTGFHIGIATEGIPSGIKIIYMFLLVLYLITFIASLKLWRKALKVYWIILEVYTMVVLVVNYTYQFQNFPGYWKNFTHFNDEQLSDLGLFKQENASDLIRLMLPPTIFLLCIMVQLHYVNAEFLKGIADPTPPADGRQDGAIPMTKMKRASKGTISTNELNVTQTGSGGNFMHSMRKAARYVEHYMHTMGIYAMRFLEFHTGKLVYITVMMSAIFRPSSVYAVLVIFWIIVLPCERLHSFLYNLSSVYISLVLLAKQFVQLHLVQLPSYLNVFCRDVSYNETRSQNMSTLSWLGFDKMSATGDSQFFYHAQGLISILILIAVERVVKRRCNYLQCLHNQASYVVTSLFPGITYRNMDNGLLECIKYYINFSFYNFGLEVSYVTTVLTIYFTQDVYAVIYAFLFLISFAIDKRTLLRKYYRLYTFILIILFIWVYLGSIGLPPSFCPKTKYPWSTMGRDRYTQDRLVMWLFLPDFFVTTRHLSIFEFLQILVVVCQSSVFSMEQTYGKDYGGENKKLTGEHLDGITVATNPTENFMIFSNKNVLHKIKVFIFVYYVWFTMAAIFFTGSANISLFCLGYLVSFFYLLVRQQVLIVGKVKTLLRTWYIVISYNIAVILIKTIMQLGACVYMDKLNSNVGCIFVQLLSLVCSFSSRYKYPANTEFCHLSQQDTGMSWDILCFVFLILQIRIYSSYGFLHVREDVISSFKLASRGAKLYKDILVDEARERESEENTCLKEIKFSMQKMKEKYASLHGQMPQDMDHYDAIRSGNELMFEELDHVLLERGVLTRQNSAESSIDDEEFRDAASEEKELKKDSFDDRTSATSAGASKPVTAGTSEPDTAGTVEPDTAGTSEPADNDKASTSNAEADRPSSTNEYSDSSSNDEANPQDPQDVSYYTKFKNGVSCAYNALLMAMAWSARKINSWNYKYRNIHAKIEAEKAILSKQLAVAGGSDGNASQIGLIRKYNLVDGGSSASLPLPKNLSVIKWSDMRKVQSESTMSKVLKVEMEGFDRLKHPAVQLINALWYSFITRTELVCYIMIILNLTLTASILSLVLPLAVFVWGTFSIPRPSKTFWTCTMLYLEFVICIRFLFQFDFFEWNQQNEQNELAATNPYWFPTFIGIDKSDSWMVLDLLQLLCVVFHVNVIKTMGLWNITSFADNVVDDLLRLRESKKLNRISAESAEERVFMVPSSSVTSDYPKDPTAPQEATSATQEEDSSNLLENYQLKINEVDQDEELSYFCKLILKMKMKANYAKREGITPSFGDRLLNKIMTPFVFYWEVLHQRFTLVSDVYIYMLFCDIINSFILLFGYWAFGSYANNKTNVIAQIQDNRVPTGFLVMLMLQFAMIFLDRALYLRKNLGGKMLFHIFLVFFIHIWLFFILPGINGSPFFNNHVAQSWYFFKALYFILSAYQIRVGYPTIVHVNFLTQSYGMVNFIAFKTFRVIPFLAELTAIMNWMFTETTLVVGEWMTMWSIENLVFELKCWRRLEKAERGTVQPRGYKYMVGGSIVFFVVLIIWFPLLLMNLVLTIAGVPNNPSEMEVTLSIDTFEPLVSIAADNSSIKAYSTQQFLDLIDSMKEDQKAQAFLSDFSPDQVVNVTMNTDSKNLWSISPPQEDILIDKLNNNHTIRISFEWTISRNAELAGVYIATGRRTVELTHNPQVRTKLADMLQNTNATDQFVSIPDLMPSCLHSQAASSAAIIPTDLQGSRELLLDLNFGLRRRGDAKWWELISNRTNSDTLQITVFSDKVSPASLNFVVSYGVLGLYVSVVLVVGSLFRSLYSNLAETVMFRQLPNVDRILHLCNDILLVRELGEFELEEELFAKLIYLYRSPQIMLKWTEKKNQ